MAMAYRERHYRSQDDLALYFRDYGDPNARRTPVLCLTGLTRNSHDYDRLAPPLAAERRVICPDYRGRGRSQYDADWRHYRPETYLNDLRHLLVALDFDRVVVIGTSLGGMLAMGLAVLAPKAIAGVVINDIGPDIAPGGLGRILSYIGVDQPQPDLAAAATRLRAMFPRLSLKTDADWRWFAEGTYRAGDDGRLHFDWDVNLARPLAAGRSAMPDLWALYRAIRRKPALALRGAVSDVLSPECFERMAREKPDLVRITVPDVGHAPTFDEPAARAALDRFIAQF